MTEVRLTVHRSANEIGGNCIEIATSAGNRIILDVGRPLDALNQATGLLPTTLDLKAPADGLLISHPHQDHYGLLHEAPKHWPVFCGEATAKLIRLTSGIFGEPIERDFIFWRSREPSTIGPFTVMPFLTDHSAFDAYMLLIKVSGKRILYSGDFRTHGRKSALVSRFMASPPPDIDVLVMEGTNLGSDKACMSETNLEADFVTLFKETRGRVFVAWSAQNLDRTVTLYRACLKVGRTLIVDLYTAEVLETLREHGKLPQPGWPNLKVVITRAFSRMYRGKGQEEFVRRMAKHGVSARKLAQTPSRWVAMIRPSLVRDYEACGVIPSSEDAWSWSMWLGYLKGEDGGRVQAWMDTGGARAAHLHTSGHASPADLRSFAKSVGAKQLVPVHGLAWDSHLGSFPGIRRLIDGEPLMI